MIAKVIRGSDFRGLQAYLLAGKGGQQTQRVAWISTRNLPGDDPEVAVEIMHATADQNVRVEKPVYHLTLSLSPEERLDQDGMLRVVDGTLRDLGLEEHQVLIVAHDDTRHQHVHLMVNRVHPETARTWRASHDYARIEKSLRGQEREIGLREVPGRHAALAGQERHRGVKLSDANQRSFERTGDRPFAEHVREVARPDLGEARSWGDLHRRLADYGLHLERRGRGLVISDGERSVKASFVDRASSLQRLEERLGPYRGLEAGRERAGAGPSERWRDLERLRRATERLVRHRDIEAHQRRYQVVREEARDSAELDRRLQRRLRSVSADLDRRLELAYREPRVAREAVDRTVQDRGLRAAARDLTAQPERFGPLRGRGGLMPSAERRQALEAVAGAAAVVRDLDAARQALDRHRATRNGVARSLLAARRALRAATRLPLSPPRRELATTAASLVKRVGWGLAARALPTPHYQLLRLTLSLAPRVMHRAMDLGMEIPL